MRSLIQAVVVGAALAVPVAVFAVVILDRFLGRRLRTILKPTPPND
jgi:predicted PurR-regulated permease PerM